MKHKSTEYINKHVGLSLCDPYDDASTEAKKEYEKKLEEYRKTDDYKNFLQMKEDIKVGRMDVSDVPKGSRTTKKGITTLKIEKKKTLAAKKLPFEIFTKEFKDFNRQREDEYRKKRRQVLDMEEEVENAEEQLEIMNGQKMKLRAEQNDAITIERQSKRAMERYRQVILASVPLKELLKITVDSDVTSIVDALKDAQKTPAINEQIKKYICELKFN
uniref:Uncharacterized protein n=1 Tax=Panagrolaimus superbus TaxID=310955 RepID=A0A914YH70_9BILA